MLEPIKDALWIVEGGIVPFFGAPYPTRSVIARLENGDLWAWSPAKLTTELVSQLDRLGSVRHRVSPNKLHHLFLREWKNAFPEAFLWGPRSTIKTMPDLTFREALTDNPPADWAADIDQAWSRGSFAMDEIVFFHRPSSTVIVADLIQALSASFLREHWGGWRILARWGGITDDQASAPMDTPSWQSPFAGSAVSVRSDKPETGSGYRKYHQKNAITFCRFLTSRQVGPMFALNRHSVESGAAGRNSDR